MYRSEGAIDGIGLVLEEIVAAFLPLGGVSRRDMVGPLPVRPMCGAGRPAAI